MTQNIHLINADVITGLKSIDDNSIDTIITSPPYWGLRNYQVDGQIGMEPALEEYLEGLLKVTKECKRVLKPTGVMFWNHGDSYPSGGGKAIESSFNRNMGIDTNSQPDYRVSAKLRSQRGKCLIMQNERLIMQMIDNQGWILRNRIIWHKPNGMPSSVTDRFSSKYEPVYMLTKNKKYHFDLDAVRIPHVPNVLKRQNNIKDGYGTGYGNGETSQRGFGGHILGKNPGDVWTIPTQPHKNAHSATFPDKLIEPMIKAGCPLNVCPKCGFIRERINKRSETPPDDVFTATNAPQDGMVLSGAWRGNGKGSGQKRYDWQVSHPTVTIGWSSCDCNIGWEPGIVLDPFAGSGTTMKMAKALGRSAIGIELNPEYCNIIKKNLLFHQHTLGNIINKFTVLK